MVAGQNPERIISWEEGSDLIDAAVTKLISIFEGMPGMPDAGEYVENYTIVYNMCIQKSPNDHSDKLYEKYCSIFEDYTKQTVLPSIMEKHDEYMLRELSQRWDCNKTMVRWLSRFFFYLDRYYIPRRNLPSLTVVAMISFRNNVYNNIHFNVKQVVIAMIHKEREGQEIDRALLKNVLDVFVQNGMGSMKRYEEDFQNFFLEETASYYSRKASSWIQEDSCPEYMIKCEDAWKKEMERVSHYLHPDTKPKLVKVVQDHLLVSVAKQLLEKEDSGCRALLRDDKKEDLARMYLLYHAIPNGLEPVAEAFRLHVTAQVNALIKQGEEDVATGGSVQEQYFQNKYMVYVTECFQNHSLFRKALEEAFEIFCNKKVAGNSSA